MYGSGDMMHNRWTDRPTDRQTDRQMDGRTTNTMI